MANFHWRTDDEELTDPVDPSQEAAPGRRRTVYALLFVVFLLVGGYGVYRSYRGVEEHLAETTERVEDEVRASHNVVQSAATGADTELFVRFLSGADARWSATQERLVAGEAWLHRPGLGLEWQPALESTSTISLSSDLTEATLTVHETYRLMMPGGEAEAKSVQLLQTSLYRLGPDRWLFSPPRPGFWGETRELSLSRLEARYPARDEVVVQRLAWDLNGMLERVCGELQGVACGDEYRLQVQFGIDPALLLPEAERIIPTWAERPPGLPAPTLVGLPVDEAGYEVLMAAYARPVVAGALTDLAGWQCCEQGLFAQALLDLQLQALGLAPLTAQTYNFRQLASQERFALADDFRDLWSESPALDEEALAGSLPASARSIVAFLMERSPDLGPAALLRELAAAESYEDWLARTTGVMPPGLSLSWRSFLYDAARGGEGGAPGAALAEESLLALCEAPDAAESRLLAFGGEAGPAPVDDVEGSLGSASGLWSYGPGGALLAVQAAEGERLQLFLWRAGRAQPVWDSGEEGLGQRFAGSSPDGVFVVLEEVVAQRRQSVYLVGEMARCLQGDCRWQRSIYRPLWSPDGEFVINTQGNLLFLTASRSVLQPFWYLDYGSSPFWLDNERFGYVQHTRDGQFASVVLGTVGYREMQTLVSHNQLQPLLPPGAIMAASVEPLPHPLTGDVFFLAVPGIRSDTPAPTYVFAISRDEDRAGSGRELLFAGNDVVAGSLSVSPSGRWLSARTSEGLLLYDLVRGTRRVLGDVMAEGPAVWSPDGSWLFVPGAGGSWLVAPGEGDGGERVAHEGVCREAVWVRADG